MTPDEAHSALLDTLNELRRTLPTTKDAWDMDAVVRLALERLWKTAGNTAEEYRRAGIDSGVEPWSELVAYRNRLAHALPGDLSADRIWFDTTTDIDRIVADVGRART